MEDVTDAAFRLLIARYGAPDVMYTEFTSADGLVLANEHGQKILRKKLQFCEKERPIVAQLFTASPERMEKAAAIVAELGFDGLDINMGCPDRAVEKSGCGAALMKAPEEAKKIIRAAKRGARGIPISVKTRIGYSKNELNAWLPALLEEGLAAVALHARTRNEMSDVPARWEHVKEAVALRNAAGVQTLIVGNGDLQDVADAREKVRESGADGAMLGRAIFGNPWLYAKRAQAPSPYEKVRALLEHLALFDEILAETTNYAVMKKHFKAYISGWEGAKELRATLMETTTAREARTILTGAILPA